MTAEHATVTVGALIGRINRRLAPKHEKLKKVTPKLRPSLGEYVLVDDAARVKSHVDIQALGRRLGVLGAHETLKKAAEPTMLRPEQGVSGR